MKKIDFEYIGENEIQYTDEDLKSDMVTARYDKAIEECDRGIFTIEALPPRYYSENELKDVYESGTGITRIKGPEYSPQERLSQVHLLEKNRITLPFMYDLQKSVHDCLIFSYRERYDSLRAGGTSSIVVGDRILMNGLSYRPEKKGDSGKTSLALLASPGCGKTSAIYTVLSRYPQHIEHDFGVLGLVHQVTYLTVECPAHSDIQSLLDKMSVELDTILGNYEPYCARLVSKEKKLEGKRKKICDFIREYHIGAIVIDEIQNMDFSATSAKSYNIFLSIINETKVCVFLIGQIDAYEKMSADAQVERRVGHIIIAQDYCFDTESYKSIVNGLSTYSWRDDKEKLIDPYGRTLSDSEIDALHKVSSGTIHLTKKCWELIQEYGIETGLWPELTYKFLHKLLKKFSPNIEKDIRDRFFINAKHLSLSAYDFLKNAAQTYADTENNAFKAEEIIIVEKEKEEKDKRDLFFLDILSKIKEFSRGSGSKWSEETLAKVVKDVLSYKKNEKKTADELAEVCKTKLSSLSSELQTKGRTKNTVKKERQPNTALANIADDLMEERKISGL